MSNNRGISIIIPCYNEEPILKGSIKEIKKVMDTTKFKYEVILIDDKSKDQTVEIIKKIVSENNNFRCLYHNKNVGRGGTVSEGIRIAKGSIVGFIDIDLETPASYIIPLVIAIQDGVDIATADRIYKFKLKDKSILHRWIFHKAYKLIVKLMLKTKLKDTETGCKFFNKERILPILDEIKDKHWFWDTEIMIRSYYKGFKIKEVPAVFTKKKEVASSLNFVEDTIEYAKNIVAFRRELKGKKII